LIIGFLLKLIPYGFEEKDSNIKLNTKEAEDVYKRLMDED
jgi:hypothetical protein